VKKITTLFFVSLAILSSSIAQEEPAKQKEKKYDQYIGVQLNQMINQIFNLKSDNSNLSPYILNYGINRKSDGWGLNVGIAYVYEDDEEISETEIVNTVNNDFSIRVGVEQKVMWGEKWLASLGIDFLYANLDQDKNITGNPTGVPVLDTRTTSNSYGMGPRGTLHYRLGQRVLIGTEASFYYTVHNEKITVIDYTTGVTTRDEPKNKRLVFLSPIVLSLTVQF